MLENKIIQVFLIIALLIVAYFSQCDWQSDFNETLVIEDPVVKKINNFSVGADGRIVPETILTEDQMKIQKEQGCNASTCHTK